MTDPFPTIPAAVPRITATDTDDRWEWTNAAGWRTSRAKSDGPLPAVIHESHHERGWTPSGRGEDTATDRTVILLPPA
ncbi:hypothetical protein [Microlunatus sp. Y2014]|uniref:hypothetical protein n=1 Tax=Microlunatus sp. Y2014 TaxID=3418488 RepID=UPI003DA77928